MEVHYPAQDVALEDVPALGLFLHVEMNCVRPPCRLDGMEVGVLPVGVHLNVVNEVPILAMQLVQLVQHRLLHIPVSRSKNVSN